MKQSDFNTAIDDVVQYILHLSEFEGFEVLTPTETYNKSDVVRNRTIIVSMSGSSNVMYQGVLEKNIAIKAEVIITFNDRVTDNNKIRNVIQSLYYYIDTLNDKFVNFGHKDYVVDGVDCDTNNIATDQSGKVFKGEVRIMLKKRKLIGRY